MRSVTRSGFEPGTEKPITVTGLNGFGRFCPSVARAGVGVGSGTGGGSTAVSTGNVATPVCQLSWWNMGHAMPDSWKEPG
jgi:hypothetical protein